jgi:hypothetical protein
VDLLVSEVDVRTRMSLPDEQEINDTLLDALGASTLQLEASLGSKLAIQYDLVDLFRIDSKRFWATLPDDLASLRLRTGFIDEESVELRVFDTLEDAMDPDVVGELIPARFYFINAEHGIIRLNVQAYDNCYVSVSYDSGFEDADDERVPDWLKEAIVQQVPYILTTLKPTLHTPEAVQLATAGMKKVQEMIAPYVRGNIAFTFTPIARNVATPA